MLCPLLAFVLAVPPRVVSATPDHGDDQVSPALREVRIEFDQDMASAGWSVCGGGDLFPKIDGKLHWESPRVLVVPVKLEPGHEYRLSMNCPTGQNTRSIDGEPAEVTPIWFKTAADEASASSVVLATEVNKTALTDLMEAVASRYSYRDRVVRDWPALWDQHRTGIVGSRSRAAFARECARVLAEAQDLHVSILVGDIEGWNVRFSTARRRVAPNVDPNTIADIVPGFARVDERVQWGHYPDGFLYLCVCECSEAATGAARKVLRDVQAEGWVRGVVLDVRLNAGGDEVAAQGLAGVFLQESRVYAKNRYRDSTMEDGWGPVYSRVVEPADPKDRMALPVAVLTGPYCMSSCESLVMMLKGAPRAVVVGASTFGSSGNPKPVKLGNGVTVFLSSWEDLSPAGGAIEGVGVAPDVEVRTESGDFQTADPVLERALQELRKK